MIYSSGDILNIREISDSRGSLISCESMGNVPFKIERIYFLYNLSGKPRGFHAHKKLNQVMVCVSGRVRVQLETASGTTSYDLNSATKGLFIGHGAWRVMSDFSENTVIAVIADRIYDENDYIRDYEQFKKYIR